MFLQVFAYYIAKIGILRFFNTYYFCKYLYYVEQIKLQAGLLSLHFHLKRELIESLLSYRKSLSMGKLTAILGWGKAGDSFKYPVEVSRRVKATLDTHLHNVHLTIDQQFASMANTQIEGRRICLVY